MNIIVTLTKVKSNYSVIFSDRFCQFQNILILNVCLQIYWWVTKILSCENKTCSSSPSIYKMISLLNNFCTTNTSWKIYKSKGKHFLRYQNFSVLGFLFPLYLGQVEFGWGKVRYMYLVTYTLFLGTLITSYDVRIWLVRTAGKVYFVWIIFQVENSISEKS